MGTRFHKGMVIGYTRMPLTEADVSYGRSKGVPALDRIDNDGNYEPGNVQWSDSSTQNSNQRKRKRGA